VSPPPNRHTAISRTKSLRAALGIEFTSADLTMTTVEPSHEQQTDRRLVAGRYRLLAQVGRGRLGEIHEADDIQHSDLAVERRVAIQLLPNKVTRDRGLFNNLKLGHTVLSAAPHPNIVPIVDFGYDGRFGYLVTDLLEGVSMRGILDDATTLPLPEVIPVIRAVGDALQFLHAKSIVHGRLTAESVFVTEDLEIRLLDVVPLDSTISILGGVASGDPFSRYDIADDIYGLACLAYEMLTGKHPFNFHALSEASRAGIKPARIDSLPEKQWNALCHALTFDNEKRTPSIADFLREFGVEGTERLRPSEGALANHESLSGHLVNEVPTTTPASTSSSSSPAATPVAPSPQTVPVARHVDALDLERSKGKRARRMPSLILAMILVGLGAWYFFGQPRDNVVWLTDYVDAYLEDRSAGKDDGGSPIIASDISPAATGITEFADVPSTITTPTQPEATRPEAENDTRAELTDSNLAGESKASSEVEANATEEATTEPADMPRTIAETAAPQSNQDTVTDDLARQSDVDESQTDPQFTLMQSVVRVSERDGSARIANPLPANTAGQVFWWTADNTAISENDYIPAEVPRLAFESGEETGELHVPLVDDSIPEPPETFLVYLGLHNPQLGRLETIARISVEIIDDDLR
jgi:serine/threonine protein kinase